MSVLPVSQNKRRALYRNIMVGLIALLGVLLLLSRVLGVDVHLATMLMLVPLLVLAPLQLSALDEAAKQAHFSAWYWGCMLAIVLIGVLAIGLQQAAIPFEPVAAVASRWVGGMGESSLFVAGLLTGPALMVVGYLIFSVIHWLRMR